MSRGIILIVDNDSNFLATRKDYLESRGYTVLPVLIARDRDSLLSSSVSLEQAKEALQGRWAHLLFMDVRLQDDGDPRDISGLILLQELDPVIPRIVLTGFSEDKMTMAEIYKLVLRDKIVSFLPKQAGQDVMETLIEEAYPAQIAIDRDIVLRPEKLTPLLGSWLSDFSAGATLDEIEAEIQDLFRKLFYGCTRIILSPLHYGSLVRHKDRSTIQTKVLSRSASEEFTVKCSCRRDLAEEMLRIRPKGGSSTLIAETLHFAAIAYKQTFWQKSGLLWKLLLGFIGLIIPVVLWVVLREHGLLGVLVAFCTGTLEALAGWFFSRGILVSQRSRES